METKVQNAEKLLKDWLDFADSISHQWWVIRDEQDPETYTAEGVKFRELISMTKEYLFGDNIK